MISPAESRAAVRSRTSAMAISRSSFGLARATAWNRYTSSALRSLRSEKLDSRHRSRRSAIIGCMFRSSESSANPAGVGENVNV